MQWPLVSRKALEQARDENRRLREENHLIYGFVSTRDSTIIRLEARLSALLGIAGAPARLAEIFASLQNDQQAEFLNTVGAAAKSWRETKPDPRRAIAPHSDYQWIGVVEGLDEEGQRVIDDLAEFLRMHREKASA